MYNIEQFFYFVFGYNEPISYKEKIMTTMTDAQVLSGVGSGYSDPQLLGAFATQPQIDAARVAFANRAPQPAANPAGPQAQVAQSQPILMAHAASAAQVQMMGVALPVTMGSAGFRLTTMPIWAYVLSGAVGMALLWLAISGWIRPTQVVSVPAPVAVTSVTPTIPQVIKIEVPTIKVEVAQVGKP